MDQNIKYAIYFLLGIIIFYLMFNEKGVEGFAESVEFIYVKVNTGDFERFVKLDDAAVIASSTAGLTPVGLNNVLTTILTAGTNTYTYYKSESGNLFIQKVVVITTTEESVAIECTFNDVVAATTGAGGGVAAAATTPSCTSSAGGEECTVNDEVTGCNGATVPTVAPDAVSSETEYYLVMKSDATINTIHKITSPGLDSLNTRGGPVVIPSIPTIPDEPGSTLDLYTQVGSTPYAPTTAAATTVTIDTFPRCSRPTSITGYTIVGETLKIGADFNVSGTCATSYTGTRVVATTCSEDNASYTLSGCTPTPDPTVTPIPYTCNNGSAVVGSSSTSTQNCASCDDGYTKRSRICVQNASCSTFITETNKCEEGKEVIDDKSCSGACSKDVCCEEESNVMMIGLGVCGIIFCLLLGGGAFVFMGNKSSAPALPKPGYALP